MEDRQGRKLTKTFLLSNVITLFVIAFVCYGVITDKIVIAAGIALLPLMLLIMAGAFEKKRIAFYCLFIINFLIPVLAHYLKSFPTGLLMDIMICFNLLVIFANSLTHKNNYKSISLDVVLAVGVWLIYCLLEVFNPTGIGKAWVSTIRNMAVYFLVVIVLAQIMLDRLDYAKELLGIWSVIVVLAVIKAFAQKYIGFTKGDLYFLNEMDGARTHIIQYGTRYFSFFSDAANFGGSMGFAMVVFAILGLHTKNTIIKIYLWVVAALACYGMLISGTRSALVVPVAGVMLYLVLVRDWKKTIITGAVLAAAIFLLGFTNIGSSNTSIRRARTLFHKDEDKSYIIRKENRAKMKVYMKEFPLGNGLGLSAGRAQKYGYYAPITEIPTDSWYVQLWVETGIIGLLLYFMVMGYLFVKGGIIVFFKLKNPEVKGIAAALLSGIAGLFVMSSNQEVFSQFPNGILVYTGFAIIFLSEKYDKESLLPAQNIDNID